MLAFYNSHRGALPLIRPVGHPLPAMRSEGHVRRRFVCLVPSPRIAGRGLG